MMAPPGFQAISRDAWALSRTQHDVVTHAQLVELGFTLEAIRHRIRVGRLFVLWPGAYALTQTRDLRRDQAHDRAGTWHSRFSHAQIAFEPGYVEETLVAKRRQIEAFSETVAR